MKGAICNTLVAIWLAGSIARLLWLGRGLWLLRQLKASCSDIAGRLPLDFASLARSLDVVRTPSLLASPLVVSPMTVAVLRPVVVVPAEMLEKATASEWEAVLIHELTHIRRRDGATAWLAQLALVAYWWNPLVVMLVERMEQLAEEICDHAVLRRGRGRVLARLLVTSAERVANARLVLTSGLFHHPQGAITTRVQRLLVRKPRTMTYPTRLSKAFTASLILALAWTVVQANYAVAQFVVGTPVSFGPIVNSSFDDNSPFLSGDGLTLYFQSPDRPGGAGGTDLYYSTRSALNADWTPPVNLAAINTAAEELKPFVTADGLNLFYDQGATNRTIYQRSRASTNDAWGPAVALPSPINVAGATSAGAYFTQDGLAMVFQSDRAGGLGDFDIWEATRPSVSDPWSVQNLGAAINSSFSESTPVISEDRLTLLFASERTNGLGGADIWLSQRNAPEDAWQPASHAGTIVNSAENDKPSQLWNNLLVFRSAGLGGEGANDMFYVQVVPEPSTYALSFSGVLLLMGTVFARRRAPG